MTPTPCTLEIEASDLSWWLSFFRPLRLPVPGPVGAWRWVEYDDRGRRVEAVGRSAQTAEGLPLVRDGRAVLQVSYRPL